MCWESSCSGWLQTACRDRLFLQSQLAQSGSQGVSLRLLPFGPVALLLSPFLTGGEDLPLLIAPPQPGRYETLVLPLLQRQAQTQRRQPAVYLLDVVGPMELEQTERAAAEMRLRVEGAERGEWARTTEKFEA